MLEPGNNSELPTIPGKRYFTIGEVSELCGVKPHVLRYWEQEFPQLKPVIAVIHVGALPGTPAHRQSVAEIIKLAQGGSAVYSLEFFKED